MLSKIPKITGLVCIVVTVEMASATLSFSSGKMNRIFTEKDTTIRKTWLGYRPVPEIPQGVSDDLWLSDKERRTGMNENIPYRKWCEETFVNGRNIYDAYREIAFNIHYTPEQEKTDYWQTPSETARTKKGDCEDAVFLFFSKIPSCQEGAEIVWGWVVDKKNMVGKAHVWYQLKDRNGAGYVVEGFSRDWSGIIPMETLERKEIREPIFAVSHSDLSRLASFFQNSADVQEPISSTNPFVEKMMPEHSLPNDTPFTGFMNLQAESFISSELQGFLSNGQMRRAHIREVYHILAKLHEVFSRYESQKKSKETGLGEVVHQKSFREEAPGTSFICRR